MIEIRRGYLEPRAALRAARDELLAERDQLQARVAELEKALRYIDAQSLDARVIAKARAALEGKQ
jgi:hypothetical protein